jgi:hypothetical protein
MTAQEFIDYFEGRGFTVVIQNESLRVEPFAKLSRSDRSTIAGLAADTDARAALERLLHKRRAPGAPTIGKQLSPGADPAIAKVREAFDAEFIEIWPGVPTAGTTSQRDRRKPRKPSAAPPTTLDDDRAIGDADFLAEVQSHQQLELAMKPGDRRRTHNWPTSDPPAVVDPLEESAMQPPANQPPPSSPQEVAPPGSIDQPPPPELPPNPEPEAQPQATGPDEPTPQPEPTDVQLVEEFNRRYPTTAAGAPRAPKIVLMRAIRRAEQIRRNQADREQGSS